MFTPSRLFILFTLALSASSLTTPYVAHSPRSHHALAARKAVPEPAPVAAPIDAQVVKPKRIRRRSDSSRCRAQSSSAIASSSAAASSIVAASSTADASSTLAASSVSSSSASVEPTTTAVPAAVEAAPTTSPTSSKAATTKAKTTTEAAKATQTAAPTSSKVTSSKAATTTSSASTSSSSEPSFLVGTQTGEGTFYSTGLGACGITNTDSDHIAAVSHLLFDTFPGYDGVNPNNNPVCGKTVTATYQGKTTTVQITDRCTGCALTDLDFSPAAFQDLADESVGRLTGMTWVWD